MTRHIIEYLRRKKNITILDLTLDVCSQSMYYKYIAGEKNLALDKVKELKYRLGADELTEAEVGEFKNNQKEFLHRFINSNFTAKEYYEKYDEYLADESQLILNEELVIDYLLIMTKYFQLFQKNDLLKDYTELLSNLLRQMDDFQKLHYYMRCIESSDFSEENKMSLIDLMMDIMTKMRDKSNLGGFYFTIALVYVQFKKSISALAVLSSALDIFKETMNFNGMIKVKNFEAMILLEKDDYKIALPKLMDNLNRCEQLNAVYEKMICLSSLLCCHSHLGNPKESKFYYQKIRELLDKYPQYFDSNGEIIMSILMNLDNIKLYDELDEMLPVINKNCTIKEGTLFYYMCHYITLKDEKERVNYLEKNLLEALLGTASFNYCRYLLNVMVEYYEKQRKYKKALELKNRFMNEFKKYYFK